MSHPKMLLKVDWPR